MKHAQKKDWCGSKAKIGRKRVKAVSITIVMLFLISGFSGILMSTPGNANADTASSGDREVSIRSVDGESTKSLANSPWPMFHGNLRHTGLSPYDTSHVDGTLKWKYQTGGDVVSSPAIGSDGTIYVGSDDYYLYAINPDGTLKWRYQTGDYVESSPAIGSDGTIYIGSGDHYLYAINPDGTLKWKYQTGYCVWSSPAIGSDGTIYVGSDDHCLYAINPDGTLKWKFQTGDAVDSSPAIGSDGTIYVGSEDGYLYAINPDSTLKWKFPTGNNVLSPAIDTNGTIYVIDGVDTLYAINPNGSLKWKNSFGDGSVVLYGSVGISKYGEIYISWGEAWPDGEAGQYTTYQFWLSAINPNGSNKWDIIVDQITDYSGSITQYVTSSPAIGSDGTIYITWVGTGNLYAIEPGGSFKWSKYVGSGVCGGLCLVSSPAIGYDSSVYVASDDSYVYAFTCFSSDLTLSSSDISFSNPSPNHGDAITISATVHNLGTDAGAFNVRFYDHLSSGDNIQIGSVKRVSGLSAGRSITVTSDSWTVPSGVHSVYVVVDADNEVVESNEDNNAAQKSVIASDEPLITSIDALYGGFSFQGISVENKYTAEVYSPDPNDPVTEVDFTLLSSDLQTIETFVDDDGSDGFSFTYDVGTLPVGLNIIQARAITKNGLESEPFLTYQIIVEMPQWLKDIYDKMGIDVSFGSDGVITFEKEFTIPEHKIGGTVDVPKFIPVIGGKVGFEAGSKIKITLRSDGFAEIYGEGSADLSVGKNGGKVGVSITADIEFLDENKSLTLKLEKAKLKIYGSLTLPIQKWPLKVFGIGVDVGVNIIPSVEMEFIFKSGMDNQLISGIDLGFEEGTGTVGIGVQVYADTDVGVGDLEVSLTGTPSMTLGVPEPYFREFALELELEASLKAFWGSEYEYSHTWRWSTDSESTSSKYSGYEPLDRNWGSHATLASIPGYNSPEDTLADDIIENDVYPLAHPSVSVDKNGNGMMLWVHDDQSKPMPQGFEIYYSKMDNSTMNWTSPQPITSDNYPDFNPVVRFLPNGDAMAVWQRYMNESLNDTVNPFEILDQVELMYSVWNHSTENWSSPMQLTNNTVFESMYHLSVNEDGKALLTYVEDPDNDIDTKYGRNIMYTIYDNGTWSSPKPIVKNITIDSAPVNIFGNKTQVIWIQDMDNNTISKTDREIFYSEYYNGTWSSPVQITNNSDYEEYLTSTTDSSGNPLISWVKSPLRPLQMKNETSYTSDGNEPSNWGFYLKFGRPTNHTAVGVMYDNGTWKMLKEGIDYTVDNSTGYVNMSLFGIPPVNATFHTWYTYEGPVSGISDEFDYTSNGSESSTWGFYLNHPLIVNETSIKVIYQNGSTDYLVPGTDYIIDKYTGYVNMTMFGIPPANASFYSSYQYISRSENDTTIMYSCMSNGTWSSPETVLKSTSIYEPQIATDSKGNVLLVWKGHSERNQTFWYSVKDANTGKWSKAEVLDNGERTTTSVSMALTPQSKIVLGYIKGDLVYSNNSAGVYGQDLYATIYDIDADLEVTPEDIKVSDISPTDGKTINVNVTVKNIGTIKTSGAQGILLDITSNDTIGTCEIPPLESGGTYNVSFNWTAPGDNITHYLKFIADSNNSIVELSESNNEATIPVVLPDIVIDASNISFVKMDGVGKIKIPIKNMGNADSQNFNLSIYEGNPEDNGTLIGNASVYPIPRNASSIVYVPWSPLAGGTDIYVYIDPESHALDSNRSNNIGIKHLSFFLEFNYTNITVSNLHPMPHESVGISVIINNTGYVDGNVSVCLYHGNPSNNDSYEISNLTEFAPAGELTEYDLSWTAEVGTHSLYLKICPEHSVSRSISVFVANFTVTNSPDMTFNETYVIMDNKHPSENDTVNITINVENHGYCDLFGSTVTLYKNNSGYLKKLSTLLIDFLPMQGNRTLTFTVSNLTKGQWNLLFVADANNIFIESNESNNNMTFSFYVNQIPVLNLDGLNMSEDEALNINLWNYTDDDNSSDEVSYTLISNSDPNNVTVNISGQNLSINPAANWSGNITIVIEVSDGLVRVNYTYVVEIYPVNDKPYVAKPLKDFSIPENYIDSSTVNLSETFKDVDSTLNFSYSGNHNISVSIAENGTVTFIPDKNWTGKETITFYASDQEYTISDNVTITVYETNPPTHSDEYPVKYTKLLKPTISVHVTDDSGVNSSTIRLYVQGFSVYYTLEDIPNGYNVSYYHESGFSPGEVVKCRIVAEDIYGNKLDYSWSFTVLSRKNITLHQRWNLVTVRWSDEPVDINTAIDGNWTRAMVYIDGQWYTYNKNREAKYNLGFPRLNNTVGLWIYSPSKDNITSYYLNTPTNTTIHLHKGWNLVGYPSGNDSKVSDALYGVPWIHLQTADAYGNIYSLSSDDYLIVNRAYWIYMNEDCDWTVDW